MRQQIRPILTAALSGSDRTTRPVATNCRGHVPPKRAGQFTEISTVRPIGSRSCVVKRIPPLPIFSVTPVPLTLADLVWTTRYRTSSRTGNLEVPLRSGKPP